MTNIHQKCCIAFQKRLSGLRVGGSAPRRGNRSLIRSLWAAPLICSIFSSVCSKPFKSFGVSLFNIDYSISFSQSITLNRLFNLSLSWTQDRTPSLRGVLFQELPFKCLCIFVAIQNPISMSINQYIRAVGLHSMKRNSLDILLG